ncbi:MAG: hypothetical protein WKF37_10295 [Bryobacteraceae bacterium]
MKLLHFTLLTHLTGSMPAQKEASELGRPTQVSRLRRRKRPDSILQWSNKTSEAARKAVNAPKGAEQPEAEHKAQSTTPNKGCLHEYAIYAAALGEADPQRMRLTTALEERNEN